MANAQLGTVIRYIRDVAVIRENRDKTDSQLLTAFIVQRDQDAFSALVKRHGPLVLSVCRRILNHAQDAEDAFQATFLVLARHAASIRKRESLASWLHGAAYRMSKSARRAAARRRNHESQAQARQTSNPVWTVAWQEVQSLVDEETQRLPPTYREAFILCCLENRCYAEVARKLGQKEVTIRSRLARARLLLQKRLTKRGVSLTAVLSVAAIASDASAAAMSAPLIRSTVKASLAYAAGKTTAGIISSEVAALVQGITRTMFYAKVKITTALLLAVSVGTAGFGILGRQVLAGPSNQAESTNAQKESRPKAEGQAEAVLHSSQDEANKQSVAVEAATKAAPAPFRAYDSFDGKLALKWQPIRYDPSHVSLTKFPGQLTITTQQGTIYADGKAKGGPRAKNIFVMPNPLRADADFVMTTSITAFKPEVVYQQAGLICYDDDDNYIKWSYEHDNANGGQQLILVRETDAKPLQDPAQYSISGLKQVWLRLTKRGDQYEYAASSDGKKFVVYGERPWGKKSSPKTIGIFAKNGGEAGVPEIDARFDFFELRSPAPAGDAKGRN
jgi:RNA polymerase sigma factor (sigma-70 family)